MALKITALMVVINQEDWVWWALKSIYDAVDHICIVEGVARDNWKEFDLFTSAGLSIDNTPNIIQRFIKEEDPDNKIEYSLAGFMPTKNSLRNLTLKICPEDTDYCLIVDSDQMYRKDELDNVRAMCEEFPHIRVVYARHWMFFLTMHDILEVREDMRKRLGYHCHQFWFRYTPELRYNPDVYFSDNALEPRGWLLQLPLVGPEELHEWDKDIAVYPPQFHFWHFGWVNREEKIKRHLMKASWMQMLRIERQIKEGKTNFVGKDRGHWLRMLEMSTQEILDYYKQYHKIWTGVFDLTVGEELVPYGGQYPLPGMIETHPFWGKGRDYFGNFF
jgi:hypothetical protein